MRFKKRLILFAALPLLLSACGGSKDPTKPATPSSNPTPSVQPTPTSHEPSVIPTPSEPSVVSPSPTEEPTPILIPSVTPTSTMEPTLLPTTPVVPTPTPSETPTPTIEPTPSPTHEVPPTIVPSQHGTFPSDPLSFDEAYAIAEQLEPTKDAGKQYYVMGTVINHEGYPQLKNGRISFYIGNGEHELLVYNCQDFDNKAAFENIPVKTGDVVVVAGTLKNYENSGSSTLEICYVKNVADCYLISINGKDVIDDPTPVPTPSVEVTTVSSTIEEIAALYDWESGTQYSSFQLDTVVSVSSSGTANTGKYYENGQNYRLYKNEDANLTVAVTEGHSLYSVKVTYESKDNGVLEGLSSNVTKNVSGTSVTFNVSNSNGANKGQVRITAIEVTYTGEAGQEIEDPNKRDYWTEDELDLIDLYLYGAEIPFLYVKGAKAEYDSDYEQFYYYGGKSSINLIMDYASLFEASEDWELYSEDDAYYQYSTSIETDLGVRFLLADIFAIDEDGYFSEDGTGEFYLAVYDPYYYEWPEDYASYLSQYFNVERIPSLDGADYYEIDNNYLDDYGYAYIYCYGDESLFDNYRNVLSDWTISEEADEFGFYTATKEGCSLQIDFGYYDGTLSLIFSKHLEKLDIFPLEQLKAIFGEDLDIPALEAEYYTLDGQIVTAYGVDSDTFSNYLKGLNDSYGYYELTDEDDNFVGYVVSIIADNKEVLITISEFDGGYTFTFANSGYLYSEQFPEEALNEFLTAKSIDSTVPALPADGYLYLTTLDSLIYYDSFEIKAKGNNVDAWLNALRDTYDVPSQQTDYGYECTSNDLKIEIDVIYYEEENVTYATIYSYDDLMVY